MVNFLSNLVIVVTMNRGLPALLSIVVDFLREEIGLLTALAGQKAIV